MQQHSTADRAIFFQLMGAGVGVGEGALEANARNTNTVSNECTFVREHLISVLLCFKLIKHSFPFDMGGCIAGPCRGTHQPP